MKQEKVARERLHSVMLRRNKWPADACTWPFTAYEFDISEADCVAWSRWDLVPITTPVSVARYCTFSIDIPELGPNSTRAEHEAVGQALESMNAKVADGLYHIDTQPNGGGIWIAYDRQQKRAYFSSSPR